MLNYRWINDSQQSIHGIFKASAEDFVVDEIAAYPFSGSGQHLCVRLKKKNLATPAAVRLLSEYLDCSPNHASWAGLKDTRAVTTQWVSFDGAFLKNDPEATLKNFHHPDLNILETTWHERKIRTGHLKGNLFKLIIREVDEKAIPLISDALRTVERLGLPNYFGRQRFGKDGRNVERAMALFTREAGNRDLKSKGDKRTFIKKFERKLLISSLQAFLFNAYLAQRIENGDFNQPLLGDWMKKEDTGGLFLCEDLGIDHERMQQWNISPTGPMFGSKMSDATKSALELESYILERFELSKSNFAPFGKLAQGTRRPIRVRPDQMNMHFQDQCLSLTFFLPKGSYATVLLEEIFKEGLFETGR